MRGRISDARVSIDNVLDCVFFSFVVDYAVAFLNSCVLTRERPSPCYTVASFHTVASAVLRTLRTEMRYDEKRSPVSIDS